MGRLAPLLDAGRALRAADVPERAGALRGAAVRRLADDGAAGFRPAPFAVVSLADVPFAVAPLAAEVLADPLFADEPFPAEPFATEPVGFLGAALPFDVVPLAFFPPEEPVPEPVREVDDGRAPEPRAEPEGRAGRREEGMG